MEMEFTSTGMFKRETSSSSWRVACGYQYQQAQVGGRKQSFPYSHTVFCFFWAVATDDEVLNLPLAESESEGISKTRGL